MEKKGGEIMKKTALSTLALVLSVVMVATGLAWDQKGVMKSAPAVRSKDPTDGKIVLPPPSYKIVFITSKEYTGNLGGVSGGDAICQSLATAAGLKGRYKAWLSSEFTAPPVSPSTTFTRSKLPYKLRNGKVVANNWSSLESGSLMAPINITETGSSLTLSPGYNSGLAWTGTTTKGTLATPTCHGWTYDGGYNTTGYHGMVGYYPFIVNGIWSSIGYGYSPQYSFQQCSKSARIYCFEQ